MRGQKVTLKRGGKRGFRASMGANDHRAIMTRIRFGAITVSHKTCMELLKMMEREAPKIRQLEAYIEAYERGQASPGVLYGVKRLTYKEAVAHVWLYHLSYMRLILQAWVYAGDVITERQYWTLVHLWDNGNA